MATKSKSAVQPTEPETNKDTRTRLIEAAMSEFNEQGFSGTDTNRIARRAGFAPQTFYRWFKDKTEVFIAAYQSWEDAEARLLGALVASKASTKQLLRTAVAHHREFLLFRRSLRQLSLDDPAIRQARAASRTRQIAQLKVWLARKDSDDGDLAAVLFQMERLSDALAEGEMEDMKLPPYAAERALSMIIEQLRRPA